MATLQAPTLWSDLPPRISRIATDVEAEPPTLTLLRFLENVTQRVRDRLSQAEAQQLIIPRPPSSQRTPTTANPQALSPFDTPRNSGSAQDQRQHSGPTRLSISGNQWPQPSQAPSPHGSSSDNATPGSIPDRRLSHAQISSQRQVSSRHQVLPQHQVPAHNLFQMHVQGTPSPGVSFNNTTTGSTPTQHYQQSQPSFQAQHQPTSPQTLYPPQTGSVQQQPHGDNQNPGLSPPGLQTGGSTSPTSEVNPTQTLEGWYFLDRPN